MKKRDAVRCAVRKLALPDRPDARRVILRDDTAGLECSVVPEAGAEVAGLRVRQGAKWRETLYNALGYSATPPDGWDGRAPLLWPAVGRTNTPDQIERAAKTGQAPRPFQYEWDGVVYPIQMHGFARRSAWELTDRGVKNGKAFATCRLAASDATRGEYPFDFVLTVTHTLGGGRLVSKYTVAAGRENAGPMPFAIGNHIGFALPLAKGGSFNDCTIRTPGDRKMLLTGAGVLSGRSRKMDLSKPVPLSSGVYADTFLGGYTRRSAWAELADPSGLAIRITQAEKPVRGRYLSKESHMHFVFWGSPDLAYFCPEPWIGQPNYLNTGKGGMRLKPGERFVWEMRVQVRNP